MNNPSLLNQLSTVMTRWPLGTQVWHRATGERMVVDGYRIFCGEIVTLNVDDGKAGGHFSPLALSRCKLPDDTPGEEWKTGGENENSDKS